MTKYQQYAEYKDSGVEWLDDLPSHWFLKRHKYIAIFSKGRNPEVLLDNYSDGLYPYLSMDSLRGKADSKYAEYKKGLVLVEDNQPLIIWDGSNSGEFVLGRQGILSSTMASSSLIYNIENKFYWYVCICIEPEMRKHATGMGIPHVNGEELRGIAFPLPDIQEQQKIANFLDYETAKIDSLIANQEKLIELLKEKRQAVISHAVTKGLNANVALKDSGVEWLGQVPEHWEVRQLRYLGTCQNGINIGAEYFGSGSPFISYGDVYRNPELPTVFDGLVQSTENDRKIYSVRSGDVLFTRTSETIEEIGFSSTCLNDVKNATFAGFLIRFRPVKNTLLPEYSKFYFRNILLRAFFVKEMNLVTRASLSQELLKKLAVPFPSLEEQKKIADFLHSKDQIFDKLINDCKKQIELLKERRTALISAAVTGKIDVRNWQNPTEAKMEFSA